MMAGTSFMSTEKFVGRLDSALTWDIDGKKEPVIFRDEIKEAVKKVVLEIVEESKEKALPLAYITKTVSEDL